MKITRIGFDLDRVFINYPPIIPDRLIDWLYKNHTTPTLSYRIPSNAVEITIRKLSHCSLLRRPIKENIDFVNRLSQNPNHSLHLLSSRYGFLEKITHGLLVKYNLKNAFSAIHLNIHNEQPHLFKERIIKKEHIKVFIDDDRELIMYLRRKHPAVRIIHYDPIVPLKECFRNMQ